jgi:hypothetical protein
MDAAAVDDVVVAFSATVSSTVALSDTGPSGAAWHTVPVHVFTSPGTLWMLVPCDTIPYDGMVVACPPGFEVALNPAEHKSQ